VKFVRYVMSSLDSYGRLESSLNSGTFVFKQDKDIGLVRRFQSPIRRRWAPFCRRRRRATRIRRKIIGVRYQGIEYSEGNAALMSIYRIPPLAERT